MLNHPLVNGFPPDCFRVIVGVSFLIKDHKIFYLNCRGPGALTQVFEFVVHFCRILKF